MEKSNSLAETIELINGWFSYLLGKWVILLIAGIVCGAAGVLYSIMQKPIYTAELTFAPENESANMGSYASIAAQFGFDMGGPTGSAFEGENLSEFLQSRMMIENTLLTPLESKDSGSLLINYYIMQKQLNNAWGKDPYLKDYLFTKAYNHGNRSRDSILKKIIKEVGIKLNIQKKDKKLNIISAKMKDGDEMFAKLFIENLVNNGIKYYVNYRSGKSRRNVAILQRQTDSFYSLLTGGITAVAVGNDLNVNPIKQVVRAGLQKKQVDLQVNSKIYEEVSKQLELSKISLHRETPFIQIIDMPVLPLDKEKLGRLKALMIFGLAGGFLALLYFSFRFFLLHFLKPIL
ncbi:MAG: lipopolysaccharide biosynthesis protein [Ferruginibacter sp.]|nr:lipopolysaccharide biosynthesis protein [Ferruginibacter sp.]